MLYDRHYAINGHAFALVSLVFSIFFNNLGLHIGVTWCDLLRKRLTV